MVLEPRQAVLEEAAGAEVSVVEFGREVEVDALDVFGKDGGAGAEADGEELGEGVSRMRRGWEPGHLPSGLKEHVSEVLGTGYLARRTVLRCRIRFARLTMSGVAPGLQWKNVVGRCNVDLGSVDGESIRW